MTISTATADHGTLSDGTGPDGAGLRRVLADDTATVDAAFALAERCRQVDDPTGPCFVRERYETSLRWGWDLHPGEVWLYQPTGATEPLGLVGMHLPHRDNLQAAAVELQVHPEHRSQGHGRRLMRAVLAMVRERGRSIVWADGAADDEASRAFLTRSGFAKASHDARRVQRLADVDRAEVDRLRTRAEEASADYVLEYLRPPYDAALQAELSVVAASINDAPMGDLNWEPEDFDVDYLADVETARQHRGDREYRILARHRESGEAAGHTVVQVVPQRPTRGEQADTAVSRAHRGHRLGLRLKIAMMDWLAEVEPQLELVSTWNQADNGYMISVNESLGYRLDRIFDSYELTLTP